MTLKTFYNLSHKNFPTVNWHLIYKHPVHRMLKTILVLLESHKGIAVY